MFKILDRYIIKKMITTYLFVVILLVLIICVIDYTEKSDSFIKSNLPFSEIFMGYFINFAPYMANILSPLTIFITTVFVTSKLASHTEIIAILSAGISYRRILWPYIISSAIIGILIFFLIGWVLPRANKKRIDFELTYLKDKFYFDKRNIHVKVAPEIYVYMESYNNEMLTGYQFTMEKIVDGKLLEKLKGNRCTWNIEKRKWNIEFYSVHTFDGIKEKIVHGSNLDTVFSLTPSDFENTHMRQETFTFDELDAYINLLKSRGAENLETYYIEKHERIAYPFAIVILTIIGVIVSSRKVRGGAGLQIALGFALAFLYIMFVMLGRQIASKGAMPPVLSAWLPNIIFASIGFILYRRVPK